MSTTFLAEYFNIDLFIITVMFGKMGWDPSIFLFYYNIKTDIVNL